MSPAVAPDEFRRIREEFGRLLRNWRKARQLTGVQVAEKCNLTPTRVSRLESGKTRLTEDAALALESGLSLSQGEREQLFRYVAAMRDTWTEKPRADEPRGQFAHEALERDASRIRTHAAVGIPTLLQSPAYGRRVFEMLYERSQDKVHDPDANLYLRMRRHAELYNPAKQFEFLLHRGGLRKRLLDDRGMDEQYRLLQRLARRENVEVLIVPDEAQILGVDNFVILDDRSVTIDLMGSTRVSELPSEVEFRMRTFEALREWALDRAGSLAVIDGLVGGS